jgi:hypothetical protein
MIARPETVVLFHTSSHAIRAEKILGQAGIACRLTPVPRHLSSDCGVCIRVARADREAARAVLEKARLEVAGYAEL